MDVVEDRLLTDPVSAPIKARDRIRAKIFSPHKVNRKVIAFMSQNHIDPDLAIEVFVLEPAEAV